MSGVQNLGFEKEPQICKNVSINFLISGSNSSDQWYVWAS
jgi:hypothetical protein